MSVMLMHLKLLLPYQILLDIADVTHIMVDTYEGSFGFLPLRLDCVGALTPGILTFTTADEKEVFVAVDEGVLVKTGTKVLVSVRNAVINADLEKLHEVVEKEFLAVDEQTQQVRAVMAKLESNFLHKFAKINKP
jgi:F-type H+-transporting ATPase subunit epsilon